MTLPVNENPRPRIAVIDYGVGNLASVRQACAAAGAESFVTRCREELDGAAGVVLPGVGAFGSAMDCLRAADLVGLLRDLALAGRPILAICLGMQILMERGAEGGDQEGLDLIRGDVVRFDNTSAGGDGPSFKVPHMGWNEVSTSGWYGRLARPEPGSDARIMMYFAHSFYTRPRDREDVASTTDYGGVRFCSVLKRGNILGCQFHPERSGPAGLALFRAWARGLDRQGGKGVSPVLNGQDARTTRNRDREAGVIC